MKYIEARDPQKLCRAHLRNMYFRNVAYFIDLMDETPGQKGDDKSRSNSP